MKSARVMRASTAAVSETSSSSGPKARRVSPGSSGVSSNPKRERYLRRERYGSIRITRWPSVISQPAAPRCVRRTRVARRAPAMRRTRATAVASAAAGGAGFARLDQLDPDVVGRPHERDARAVGDLDRPLQQAGAEALEPLDVGLQMRGVEAEVLEPVVRARVPRAQALVRARPGDVHPHAAVLALTADKAVAEHPRLVAHDLEVEGAHVPLGRLPRIGRLQVDVVDPERHDRCPPSCRDLLYIHGTEPASHGVDQCMTRPPSTLSACPVM